MTDIMIAKEHLDGHSICLCKGGEWFTDDGRGISPMMRFTAQNKPLEGYSAADIIVGRAAAMLFVKAGIVSVYARVLSKGAKEYLDEHNIPVSYEILTEKIIDRTGKDICPMEKAVADITDPDEGYEALKAALERLKAANHTG